MTTVEYWEKRAVADKIATIEDANRQIRTMRGVFRNAQKDLNAEIERILKSISGDLAEARRIVNITELSGLRKHYTQLIDMLGDTKSASLANRMMDSLYKSGRVTRMDAMLAQVDYYCAQLYRDSAKQMAQGLTSAIQTSYFRKMYDFEQFAGKELQWATLDPRRLDILISSKWSGKNWSDRLWGHVENFDAKLKDVIGRGILTGEDTHAMAAELAKLTNTARKNAERIIRTETGFVAEQAQNMAYGEFGVTRYRFLATLDLKTSEICRYMDGKVFPRKGAKVGINFPPLHPNCRSTTIPEFDDMNNSLDKRAARDPVTGKTIYVKDMPYRDWYKKQVASNPDAKRAETMMRNWYRDKEQFAQDAHILRRNNNPISKFRQFQATKYEAPEQYKEYRELVAKERENIAFREKRGIIEVEDILAKQKANAITDCVRKKGGIDRTYYDDAGKMVKQISNHDHGNADAHPFGEHGEHAHDIVWKDGKVAGRPVRELTPEERKENRDLL